MGAGHGTILIEGHYGEVVPKNYVSKCFVLSTPPSELRYRLGSKKFSEEKIEENLQSEIMQECWLNALEAFGASKVTKINNMPISDTASLIETYLHVDLARSND